jgi:tRNA modification GTPase
MSRTIAALATPPGISGLSVIRISGDETIKIMDLVFKGKKTIAEAKSHTILYGKILQVENNQIERIIDTVTISIFKSPNSYTGEDVIEIGCHGSIVVVREILDLLYKNGAYPAEAGEFTKRAFINGKLDLLQVEAVADLIHSISTPSAQTSIRQLEGDFTIRLREFRKNLIDIASLLELELDFSEEDIELIDRDFIRNRLNNAKEFCNNLIEFKRTSEILRSGYYVSIVGYPNSGKSTLFNTLLNKNRAIVSEIAGTTRDYLEEYLYINEIAIKLFDTAGLRDTEDTIEIMGIKLVESIIKQSNLLFLLNDITESETYSDNLLSELKSKFPDTEIIVIQNKIDNLEKIENKDETIYISAKNNIGIYELKSLIYNKAISELDSITDVLINQRHYDLLKVTIENIERALISLDEYTENEIIAIDIRNAYTTIGEITGENYNEEVINNIFGAFCIGK